MGINLQSLKIYLESLNYGSFINLNEYQDKFYLKKEIQAAFPEIPDEVIYKAINSINIKMKINKLSNKFVEALSSEIISINDLNKRDNDLN